MTRYDLPDASIDDMIDRTVKIAAKVAVANGGRVEMRDGVKYLPDFVIASP